MMESQSYAVILLLIPAVSFLTVFTTVLQRCDQGTQTAFWPAVAVSFQALCSKLSTKPRLERLCLGFFFLFFFFFVHSKSVPVSSKWLGGGMVNK